MERSVITFLLIVLSSATFCQNQTDDPERPYDYDTTLSGGYHISFKVDKDMQYLYLMKQGRIIKELSNCSRGLLYQNLGYKAADFKNYFVLAHSYGSGNPHYIELFRKSDGHNVLKPGSCWIDADEKKAFLLYYIDGASSSDVTIILRAVDTGIEEKYPLPFEEGKNAFVLKSIRIKEINNKKMTLSFTSDDNKIGTISHLRIKNSHK